MFGPVYLDILTFFYPIGNTPTTCLTQNLAREVRGNLLLLGCGDVRNILFTLYSEQNNSRPLDITCCDIQDAVIARNILLFSLALADTDGTNQQMIWNIYYHFYLDKTSLQFLNNHAKKLVSMSTSLSEWHGTTYGRILRFCDLSTFTRVRALWRVYSMQDSEPGKRAAFGALLEANIQRAKNVKEYYVGNGHVTTGVRSAAPLGLAYAKTAHELYHHYWKCGSTSREPDVLAKTTLPNPLLSYHTTLHYGTDPLLGFHLATAFAPLKMDSSKTSTRSQVVEEAQRQFQAWCDALRLSSPKALTIRFFAGDAIAFAHALHHLNASGDSQPGNIYRDAYHLIPIELDREEYDPRKEPPLKFTIIDTSNLIDHLGALNLLSATSPLLNGDVPSSLYTESLVKRKHDHRAYIDSLLCGDFATISLLLDLFPMEYWTNASSSSTADSIMFDTSLRLTGADAGGQMRVKLIWKRYHPPPQAMVGSSEQRLRLDETGLAHILHDVYQNMFQHENLVSPLKNVDRLKMQENSILYYHRGSFAVFLRLVQSRVAVNWQSLMGCLLRLIETDSTVSLGLNYIQELYLYLHILDLHSADVFTKNSQVKDAITGGIGSWKDLPTTVCITLQVPRARLAALTVPKPTEIGTPIGHCILQSSSGSKVGGWQNIFSGIQIAFGTISTVGAMYSNDFAIRVAEDDLRWQGDSPLVVSFVAPSRILLLEPQTAVVAFGLQSTPHTCTKFRSLGPELNVFETRLGDEENVYISRYPPHLNGSGTVHGFGSIEQRPSQLPHQQFTTTTIANVLQSDSKISSLSVRVDLLSDTLRGALRNGCTVKMTQTAPCDAMVALTGNNLQMVLHFLVPVDGDKSKIRIARKSSYIEVEAPIHKTSWTSFPSFISLLSFEKAAVQCSDIHFLDMKMLPELDILCHSQLQWLTAHVAGMFSARERRLREESNSAASKLQLDSRVGFKDSLFSLFMHFTGLQGKQSRIFGLDNPAGGGVHILIFVSCMRLDVGSQTVVLDTAVLPLTKSLVSRIGRFLSLITTKRICYIKVDDEELDLWRRILPLYAERCRDWKHQSSCEYFNEMNWKTEDGNNFFCTCGRGFLPTNFVTGIPNWSDVARFTTRAAISPIFSVPIVDPPFIGSPKVSSSLSQGCTTCGKGELAGGGKLLNCSACHIARYCSLSCQKADWKSHKQSCGQAKENRD